MTYLSEYRDIFGVPGEGVHEQRFLGLALMDLLGFILIIVLLVMWANVGVVPACIGTTVATIGLHWLFGVRTAGNRALGLAPD